MWFFCLLQRIFRGTAHAGQLTPTENPENTLAADPVQETDNSDSASDTAESGDYTMTFVNVIGEEYETTILGLAS